MSQVKRLVDDFRAREDRSETWFANQVGMSSKTLNSWFTRGRKSPMPPRIIKSMARVLGLPYRTVLEAALYDSGYLPETAVEDIRERKTEPLTARPVTVEKSEASKAPLERGRRPGPRRSPQ